ANEEVAFSVVIHALASGLSCSGSRCDTRLRLFRLQCEDSRLAAELYVYRADRVARLCGNRTAHRGAAANDRRRVGIDEPGDAADVVVVGQFLFGVAIPGLSTTVDQSLAADSAQRHATGDDE